MKKIMLFGVLVLFALNANAQRLNPVKWTFESVKKSDKQYEIVFTANIEAPWHIYSQFVKKGPVPTSIVFKKNALVQVKGKPKENGKLEKVYDKNFGAEIAYFSNKVQFVQTITLRAAVKTNVVGEIEYMVCNDQRCLPSTKIPFEVTIQ
jgi:thiol:disulfide interchange protein DsbD